MSLTQRWQDWCLEDRPDDGARAALFRFAFFLILAVDCWENIAHLGRYGAGRFNVSHFPWMDGLLPAPEKEWVLVLVLVQVFLALRVAFGVGLKWSLPLLAASYSTTYFWSQLDSYQHHYLVAMMLWLLAAGAVLDDGRIRGWTLRGLGGLVTILYFWAAVAKMDPLWLDGQTINTQITPVWARELFEGHYAALAWLVLLVELGLAAAWQVRRLAPFALVVGVGMHISIEVLDFRIGVFSYLMVAMYTLLLPEGVVRWLTDRVHVPSNPVPGWLLPVVAAAVAMGWWLLPFQGSALVAAGVLVVLVPLGVRTRAQALVQLAFPLLLWTACGMSDVARDYYRYIGGDTRRRALPEEALDAYTQVTHIDPTYFSGHIRRGDLLMTLGRPAEALDAFTAAAALEPGSNDLPRRIEAAEAALGTRP